MICTKCGQENPDEAYACARCGRKLQSARRAGPETGGEEDGGRPAFRPFRPFEEEPSPLGKYFESLAYACILAGGITAGIIYGVYWPIYVLAGIVGLVAWLRRI